MTIFAQVYIDEDVDVLVATLLLARGFDATSVSPIPHKATKPPSFVWCQLSKTWNQCQKADLQIQSLKKRDAYGGLRLRAIYSKQI
ncbi:hypothetical protein A6769_14470 [Nostoc punctiforme NIES-2108]|uniref:DUF5615 domain-containing protein n=1 Tax=Nostoc punctiforme NIES-2108 TaxID=1356359 RepID=A0A367RJG8_NOSPU|nr:hypothetical protein A6769_14470 [Nostoc punctiforme NIES-2108]